MKRESWVKIEGSDDYEVSDNGNVRKNNHRGIFTMRVYKTDSGYRRVTLNYKQKPAHRRLSRLVLAAFVGPCPKGYEAAHLNGQKDDDRIENLKWATAVENNSHKKLHGTSQVGSRNGNSRLTEKQVIEIRTKYSKLIGIKSKTASLRELAKQFFVNDGTIRLIVVRKTWAHV